MRYFITPNHCVAANLKVGSSSVARAIILAHHPDVEAKIQRAAYPAGKGPDNTQWQGQCPSTEKPDRPVLLLVRDPVERFRSAAAQFGFTDADAVLDALESGEPLQGRTRTVRVRGNEHFAPQSDGTRHDQPTRLYRFPDHLEAVASAAGLAWPLPTINESEEKPALTDDRAARVRAFYAADAALFDSIVEAGQEHVRPADPPEPPSAAQRARKAEAEYRAALEAGIAVGGIVLAAGEADQLAFLQGAVLLDVAEKLADDAEVFRQMPVGAIFGRSLLDRDGQSHDPTVTEYRLLVAAYGRAIGSLQAIREARKSGQ